MTPGLCRTVAAVLFLEGGKHGDAVFISFLRGSEPENASRRRSSTPATVGGGRAKLSVDEYELEKHPGERPDK